MSNRSLFYMKITEWDRMTINWSSAVNVFRGYLLFFASHHENSDDFYFITLIFIELVCVVMLCHGSFRKQILINMQKYIFDVD